MTLFATRKVFEQRPDEPYTIFVSRVYADRSLGEGFVLDVTDTSGAHPEKRTTPSHVYRNFGHTNSRADRCIHTESYVFDIDGTAVDVMNPALAERGWSPLVEYQRVS